MGQIEGLREGSLYYQAYYLLRQPLMDMMFDGVAWDSVAAATEKERLLGKKEEIRTELDRLTGVPLRSVSRRRSAKLRGLFDKQKRLREDKKVAGPRTPRSLEINVELGTLQQEIKSLRDSEAAWDVTYGDALSGKQLAEYLYGTLGLPGQTRHRKASGKKTVTVDDLALQKLAQKYGDRKLGDGVTNLGGCLQLVREHRRCEKLVSTYLNPDKLLSPVDGRFHTMYKTFGTQTGRLASGSDPWNYGGNAQNIDRDLKWLMLPI